jgi:hypothetical protein
MEFYTLGDLLIHAREHQGYTHHDVEKSTHIRTEYLQALELSQYEELPADIYTRGILKTYCRFLNIPYREAIKLYLRDDAFTEDIKPDTSILKAMKQATLRRLLQIVGIVSVGILLVGYMIYQYQSSLQPPPLEITNPRDEFTESISESIAISGESEPGTTIQINSQTLTLDPEGRFEIEYQLDPGENTIKVIARSNFNDKMTEVSRDIFYNIEPTRSDVVFTTSDQDITMIIEDQGEILYTDILVVGEELPLNMTAYATIKTNVPESTEVQINGITKTTDQDEFALRSLFPELIE